MPQTNWVLPALGALLVWGLWGFFPKLGTHYLPPAHLLIYEILGSLVVAAILLVKIDFQLEANPRGIICATLAGITAVVGALLYLNACSRGPVTVVVIVTGLYPMVTVFLSWIFLGETLSMQQIFGALLACVSIYLLVDGA